MVLLLSVGGCYKEADLQPTEAIPQYTLPQGNQPYDQRIVDFYKQHSSFILYKFNEVDFRWNFTTKILFTAEIADPSYVATSLDFLLLQVFDYYKPQLLHTMIPYKVLLCKEIIALDGSTEEPLPGYVDGTWSYSHIAFGHVDARWTDFTDEKRLQVKGRMHGALWASAIARKKLTAAPDFIKEVPYNSVQRTNYKTYGLFEYSTFVYDDVMEYVSRITCYTKAEMDLLFLNDEFDPTGIYRRKYAALIAYYRDNYDIDLQAIGNARLKP